MAPVLRFGTKLDPARAAPPDSKRQSRGAASPAPMADFSTGGEGTTMTDAEIAAFPLRTDVPGSDPISDMGTIGFDRIVCATSWPIGGSFGWVWDPVISFRAAFRDGTCRCLRSRRMAAGNAVGGHRTLNKTDILFCRSLTEHSPRARAREML